MGMNLTPLSGGRDDDRKLTTTRTNESMDIWDVFAAESERKPRRSLMAQAQEVRAATAVPAGKRLRRLIFMWLRIYVFEVKYGKAQRVNVAIPIPIPLIGALFGGQLSLEQALKVARLSEEENDADAAGSYLDSAMGLELVRVDQVDEDADKRQLVVIGLD